jgi:hypothetical protein
MTDMIERVATALYEQWAASFVVSKTWDGAKPGSQAEFRTIARTAIAAMREPTEEMIFDGGKAVLIVHHTLNTGDVYRAMIDAALEEKK